MEFNTYSKDIQAIKISLDTCARRGLGREQIIIESIGYLMGYYERNPEKEYLLGAILQIRVYLEMGYAYEKYEAMFDRIIQETGKKKEEIIANQVYTHMTVRLNRSQIRYMLRKWSPSRQNEMTIKEVVNDIYEKVTAKEYGTYYYTNHTSSARDGDDVYVLVINNEECYFHDLKLDRYYEMV